MSPFDPSGRNVLVTGAASGVVDINLTGVFPSCRAEGRRMLEHGVGSIVSIASMSATEGFARDTPMGRRRTPDDLVGPAVFLPSDAASDVTGADLPVDGGFTGW